MADKVDMGKDIAGKDSDSETTVLVVDSMCFVDFGRKACKSLDCLYKDKCCFDLDGIPNVIYSVNFGFCV